MHYIYYSYIIIILWIIYRQSRKGLLYIFSPLITLHTLLITADIIPLLISENIEKIPKNIYQVTALACIANLLILFCFRKQLSKDVFITIPKYSSHISSKRKYFIFLLLAIEFMYGFITGVTPLLLKGADVSFLRKTNEIGLGFINAIPQMGIPILLLVYMLTKGKKHFYANGIKCLGVGSIFYIATAARAGILTLFNTFITWFCIAKRGLKWYEYFSLYFILGPIVANITNMIRKANDISNIWSHFFSQEVMIFHWNTIPLMDYFEKGKFLWGESYYAAAVRFIPRFLWEDKPLSIDYKYKEILGYDVPGGIYTTLPCDLYINFGFYFIIPYIMFLILSHLLYNNLLNRETSFYWKICTLYLLTRTTLGTMISGIEELAIFLCICYLFYKRKNLI